MRLGLALSKRSDTEPSIMDSNDKIELSDGKSMEPVTRKSLSLWNTCNVPLVKICLLNARKYHPLA